MRTQTHSRRPLRARAAAALAVIALAATSTGVATVAASPAEASDGWSNIDEFSEQVRRMTFPADGDVYYSDTWMAPRSSGRRHLGVDIMGDKLIPLLAVRDGCISYLSYGGPGGGNMLTLTDDEGWQYRYIHINNDTPGTDDGANPYEWAFLVEAGDCVNEGQHIAFLGDSGNAEWTGAHLHFEVRRPDGIWINPYPSARAAQIAQGCAAVDSTPPREPSDASARGYWLLDDSGRVHAFNAPHLGDLTTIGITTQPASMTATASGEGYWIVDVAGHVHAFGDAPFHGDMTGVALNGPIRRLEPHPNGDGYWLIANDGGVFTFGNADFWGSNGAEPHTSPVISMTSTSTGDGYYLIAADGKVFTYGDATDHGDASHIALNEPIIDMAVPASGEGYWLYAADGGVFTYGALEYHGSAPGLGRCDVAESVALRVSDSGLGYWILTKVGEVLPFGDAAHRGDQPTLHVDGPGDPSEHRHAVVLDMAIHHAADQ